MFRKILIANRGEIAFRIIRACKEMGIGTVAVFSEADRDLVHLGYADESICIGPPQPARSYLHIPSIISAAEIADVEAIHPGYGFLSENAHFAEICSSCRIEFIGPSPDVMKTMGDKSLAKKKMNEAGIPIIEGSDGPVKDKDEALRTAHEIGYPVIIKASAGGGGKGMKIAHNDMRLVSAFYLAQSEAESSFGDSRLYIEKFVDNPRHIEFQIIADKSGNTVHLGERDCTIQRRHQKLIEEAPAPSLSEKKRKEMGEAAIKCARAIGYAGVGTVEFLVDSSGSFFFMEMNTRLQVEHPVTEMVTNIDIVKEQIRIAAGEKLGYSQHDIKLQGAAIECRINAEDPDNDFTPNAGVIRTHQVPGGPGVRVDTHLYVDYTIPTFYDSLLSKLVAYGKDREEATARMRRALDEYVIEDVKTTIPLFKRIFASQKFARANYDTGFIEDFFSKQE